MDAGDTPSPQRLMMPWDQKKWPEIKRRLATPCASIVDLEALMVGSRVRQRTVVELFTLIYGDAELKKDLPPQEHFVKTVVPWMQELILNGAKTFRTASTALLAEPGCLVFTRPQATTVLACIFFGMTMLEKGSISGRAMPEPTFRHVFANSRPFPLQCMIGYFSYVHVLATAGGDDADIYNAGMLVAKRVSKPAPAWDEVAEPFVEPKFALGSADDSPNRMHIVSCSAIIGGDSIFGGNLMPDEIIMCARPEAFALACFCPQLGDLDALVIMGAEKVNRYVGTGASVAYVGPHDDMTPRGYSLDETEVMTQTALIFIDAGMRPSGQSQFIGDFMRDTTKAYIGMSALKWKKSALVATGPWVAPTGNNIQLKFVQLMLASSLAGVPIVYHSPSDDFEDSAAELVSWLAEDELTTADLLVMYLRAIQSVKSNRLSSINLFKTMMDV